MEYENGRFSPSKAEKKALFMKNKIKADALKVLITPHQTKAIKVYFNPMKWRKVIAKDTSDLVAHAKKERKKAKMVRVNFKVDAPYKDALPKSSDNRPKAIIMTLCSLYESYKDVPLFPQN